MDLTTFAFGFGASVAASALAVLVWHMSRREPSKAVLVKRLDHAEFTFTQRMSPEQAKTLQEAMRGGNRNGGKPRTVEILHRAGKWYASVVYACEPKRQGGKSAFGLDWGVESFATISADTGDVEQIANPRHLRKALKALKAAQQDLSRKKRGSNRRRKAKAKVAALHQKVANRRQDFLHQTSAKIVSQAGLIATETLNVAGMTASGGRYKRGLNREILASSPRAFLAMLRYKAEEAGVRYVEIPTRTVKPSQTCSGCGLQRKKALSERVHECECGLRMGRDANAARVMLNWALSRLAGLERAGRGAGAMAFAMKRKSPVELETYRGGSIGEVERIPARAALEPRP